MNIAPFMGVHNVLTLVCATQFPAGTRENLLKMVTIPFIDCDFWTFIDNDQSNENLVSKVSTK
jgi:hypothetical protein